MPKTTRGAKRSAFSWNNVPALEQWKLLEVIGGDGHTIWDADALKREIDAYVIDAFTTVERSDGSLKGSIFTDDGIVKELRGVYGLTVIRSLASHYGVTSHKHGRGSEARELTEGILDHLRPFIADAATA